MRITSTRVETRGAHDHVTVWIDGANSGTLIVSEGAGPALVVLLTEDACDCCGERKTDVDEYTGVKGRICGACHADWCEGQRENPEF